MDTSSFLAIDPAALILRGEALYIYYLLHHPHEPVISELQRALAKATPEELQGMRARAKALIAYATTVEKAIATMPNTAKAK